MASILVILLFVLSILAPLIHFIYPRRASTSTGSYEKVHQTDTVEKGESRRLQTKMRGRLASYKSMYCKLQNLEDFPEVLPEARQMLESLLQQGLIMAQYKPRPRSILDIKEFDPIQLQTFIKSQHAAAGHDFESYIRRRQAGSGPEMFTTTEEAHQFLRTWAPNNLIDGAWVARIHQVTTPFALRSVSKNAWQIFSEELGDGDLEKNHVVLYRDLLRSVGIDLPDADSDDFIHPRHEMNSEPVWRYAVGQLLVSTFPNDFLPEILGFNLYYESPKAEMSIINKELPEFGISPYYFALHISIDNADSGHCAMALANIIKFMDIVRETGLMDHSNAWKRVQAGYCLAQSLADKDTTDHYEDKLMGFLLKKARISQKIHCASRARFGKRSLSDWLSASELNDNGKDPHGDDWKEDFLAALADSKPWVRRGDSSNSRLMREVSWKGRMFGAFTQDEVAILRVWIDSLENKDASSAGVYWKSVGVYQSAEKTFDPPRHDVAVTHPVFPPMQHWYPSKSRDFKPQPPIQVQSAQVNVILPLWFVHQCLLENIISSPYKTVKPLASICLQILRAEKGYRPESGGIACMDEQLRPTYSQDLFDIGLDMIRGHKLPEPTCLGDILGAPDGKLDDATKLSFTLLSWAQRPAQNGVFLAGLARAFLDLEMGVAKSETLLGGKEREHLEQIIERKAVCFEKYLAMLKEEEDEVKYHDFIGGYEYGRTEMDKLLQ